MVGFTTRVGGVSTGPYSSLNLGRSTGDDARASPRTAGGRARSLDADPSRLASTGRSIGDGQRALPGSDGTAGDGLWTDEPGTPMLALAADCVPIALAAPGRARLAVLHAGWRGLSRGVIDAGATALRCGEEGVELAAAIGPSVGPVLLRGGR